jgi:hypothetical protein
MEDAVLKANAMAGTDEQRTTNSPYMEGPVLQANAMAETTEQLTTNSRYMEGPVLQANAMAETTEQLTTNSPYMEAPVLQANANVETNEQLTTQDAGAATERTEEAVVEQMEDAVLKASAMARTDEQLTTNSPMEGPVLKANANVETNEQLTTQHAGAATERMKESVAVKEIDTDVEFAQAEAHEAVSQLEVEIIGAIERLAALFPRLTKLHEVIGTLNQGDIEGEDAQTLFGIRMLAPVPEDMEADVLGTILHQGNIFTDDGEGETCIGWVVGDVEARVQQIEEAIVLRTPAVQS